MRKSGVVLFGCDAMLPSMLTAFLQDEYDVVVAASEDEVRGVFLKQGFDVVILELAGAEDAVARKSALCDELVEEGAVVLVMAGDDLRSSAMESVRRGAFSLIRKPPALRELRVILRRAQEFAKSKGKLSAGRQAARPPLSGRDRLVGTSPAMQAVYELIDNVASINAPVLITGESGTGKELVARAIHNLGTRANRPFVAVSCGAIPETLIEAELFGHEKGAFTGTVGSRMGYFEQAGDGTLFLDEIGELSPQTQVKLLRVLAQREFSRLGNNRLIPLHARVLFATHRDLGQMTETGEFRRDLYYRVNVLRIQCPPLREHSEDIAVLAEYLTAQYSALFGKRVIGLDPEALALLTEYEWRGNVRELENVIQHAVIVAKRETIAPSDLPDSIRQEEAFIESVEIAKIGSFETKLQGYKVRLAMQAILECRGNKTLAAKSLNISRAYLHRLIRELPDDTGISSDVA